MISAQQPSGKSLIKHDHPSSGAINKFRKNAQELSQRQSGIPRPRPAQSTGMRTMVGNTRITKAKGRQSHGDSGKRQSWGAYKTSFHPRQTNITGKQKSGFTENSIPAENKGLKVVFKEVIPMGKKNYKMAPALTRKPLENLSNSPATIRSKFIKETKIPDHKKAVTKMKSHEQNNHQKFDDDQKGIEFEADPQALASILNNQGITVQTLQQNAALCEGRPSMVQNNTLLFPDGRPSLCRRVPIKPQRQSQIEARQSMNGPQRVLSTTKKGSFRATATGQRNSFIQAPKGSTRNSLYSVVQGRYSNTAATLAGRQSLPIGHKTNADKTAEVKHKQVIETEHVMKSPAQRVLSREIRVSASPALRNLKPTRVTPLPGRVKKKGNQRGVKWADENSPCVRDKLAIHLFQDSPQANSPSSAIQKHIKTPVSILKSRKHSKRNSLTPPIMKKEKPSDATEEEECTIEIVQPNVLNDQSNKILPERATKKSMDVTKTLKSKVVQNRTKSPSVVSRKMTEIVPKVLSENSCVLNRLGSSERKVGDRETEIANKNVIEINQVLQIMNSHLSNVKRRSVQSEFGNVMKHITATLKAPGLLHEDIQEEDSLLTDNETVKSVAEDQRPSVPEVVHSPTREKIHSCIPITPGTLKDIRENCDEDTNRSLDEIAMETERINRELDQLKLQKEKLNAFQQRVKKFPTNTSERKAKRIPPPAIVSEKCPAFSIQSPDIKPGEKVVTEENQLNSSWDKVLKSEMNFTESPRSDFTDIKATSMDFTNVSPLYKAPWINNFVMGQSPQISALHLENPSRIFKNLHPDELVNSKSIEIPYNGSSRETKGPGTMSPLLPGSPGNQSEVRLPSDSSSSKDTTRCGVKFLTKQPVQVDDDVASELAKLDFSQLVSKKRSSPQSPEGADLEKQRDFNFTSLFINSANDEDKSEKEFYLPSKVTTNTVQLKCEIPTTKSSMDDNVRRTFTENPKTDSPKFEKPFALPEGPPLTPCDYQVQKATNSFSSQLCSPMDKREKPQGKFCFSPLVAAPVPRFPLPPQTPCAFRALKMRINNDRLRSSPAQGKSLSSVKQPFAQALLDEEVSLLTCRVVRPSTLLGANSVQDPVAQSLSVGDATHFVPIPKTPSTPKRNRRSSFSDSAFSKYLRS